MKFQIYIILCYYLHFPHLLTFWYYWRYCLEVSNLWVEPLGNVGVNRNLQLFDIVLMNGIGYDNWMILYITNKD